ncbi:MAG: hypothetical protein NTV42_00130 [Chloroflexi bacterium]|nr:hypothetical protein [Chloroflexota bacterium]
MEFSVQPVKIQNEDGRWFMVVSRVEGGYLARDSVTSDLVYMKHSDIAGREEAAPGSC